MDPTLIVLLVVVGLIVLAVLFFVVIYNGLIGLRNRVKEAWADIDVQLKRRYDLIPNVVEAVKGYAGHEKETFTEVTQARNQAHAALSQMNEMMKNTGGIPAAEGADPSAMPGPGSAAKSDSPMRLLSQAEGMLERALNRFLMTVEDYPDLKADQNFLHLQEELVSTENKISFARQHYNDEVRRYNTKREVIPNIFIANMAGFKTAEFFELTDQEQREAPKVAF